MHRKDEVFCKNKKFNNAENSKISESLFAFEIEKSFSKTHLLRGVLGRSSTGKKIQKTKVVRMDRSKCGVASSDAPSSEFEASENTQRNCRRRAYQVEIFEDLEISQIQNWRLNFVSQTALSVWRRRKQIHWGLYLSKEPEFFEWVFFNGD